MRVLIIGSGGREHALSWKVAQSGKAEKIYCAPGNGGTAQEGENIPLKDSDIAGLVSFAKENAVDFVIPGPELPLTLGVVDAMTQAGIRCFGPSRWCAQLEGSKAFAKDIMQKAGVPTAACGVFTELEAAQAFVEEKGAPIVIKADGLAAGKGVVVAQTKEEALEALGQIMGGMFGAAGSRVVIEEFLVGEEVSLLAFCDGKTAPAFRPFPVGKLFLLFREVACVSCFPTMTASIRRASARCTTRCAKPGTSLTWSPRSRNSRAWAVPSPCTTPCACTRCKSPASAARRSRGRPWTA